MVSHHYSLYGTWESAVKKTEQVSSNSLSGIYQHLEVNLLSTSSTLHCLKLTIIHMPTTTSTQPFCHNTASTSTQTTIHHNFDQHPNGIHSAILPQYHVLFYTHSDDQWTEVGKYQHLSILNTEIQLLEEEQLKYQNTKYFRVSILKYKIQNTILKY